MAKEFTVSGKLVLARHTNKYAQYMLILLFSNGKSASDYYTKPGSSLSYACNNYVGKDVTLHGEIGRNDKAYIVDITEN